MLPKVIAFDCFGTVFNMEGVSREEIADYVEHVKRNDFAPYTFPDSWWELNLHPDAKAGIGMLQDEGIQCVTLSNGSADLLEFVSGAGGVKWDKIIDLAKHKVYKPHVDAYRTVEKETGCKPEECLMVTANPTFGDLEGAAAIGMPSQVIRQPGEPESITQLAVKLIIQRMDESNDRRLKIVRFNSEATVDAFNWLVNLRDLNSLLILKADGLPEDAKVYSFYSCPKTGSIEAIVQHESFDLVPHGTIIPEFPKLATEFRHVSRRWVVDRLPTVDESDRNYQVEYWSTYLEMVVRIHYSSVHPGQCWRTIDHTPPAVLKPVNQD